MNPLPVAEDNKENYVELDFSSNVVMDENMLLKTLSTIDIMDGTELYKIVHDYYNAILNNIFHNKENGQGSPFTYLFTVPKFIITLTQIMYVETPDDTTRRRLNKMSYDYLVLKERDQDKYVSGLLMSLSKAINKDKIPKLCTLQLSEEFASLLLLARYSSEKEIINVRRLNRVLINQPLSSLSEQKIVDIYIQLFSHVLPLFTGIMLDVMPTQTMTPDMQEIYGLITLAALDIMNELPLQDIKAGLTMFNDDRKIQYSDMPLRMNLESCSPEDYPRFIAAIDELKSEGVYIETR